MAQKYSSVIQETCDQDLLRISRLDNGDPEIFESIQGEGVNLGNPCIFLRLAGCNLKCAWCDTKYTWDWDKYKFKDEVVQLSVKSLIDKIKTLPRQHLVVTGGEPLLQMDQSFIDAFHHIGFKIAIQTNGTVIPPKNIDWICVSPKIGSKLILKKGNELKLVYPQSNGQPKQFEDLDFDHFSLQPMDGSNIEENTRETIAFCHEHPHWRLSLQTHKFLGIP